MNVWDDSWQWRWLAGVDGDGDEWRICGRRRHGLAKVTCRSLPPLAARCVLLRDLLALIGHEGKERRW